MDDALLDRLASDLKPVRPRSPARDFALVGGFLLGQLLLVFLMGLERVDLPSAMGMAVFWWRALGCGLVGLAAAIVTVTALGPADRPRLILPLAAAALALGGGLALLLATPGDMDMSAEAMREGYECTRNVFLFALPLAALFAWLLHRGAPARPRLAAGAAAISAAAWGAALFTFHCPHDDMAHSFIWYPLALGVTALLLALGLRRFARW